MRPSTTRRSYRRSDGTVTAAWVITDPMIASLRLSTADLGSSATLFAARDDVEGFGATSIVGATDMAQLPGAALGLVASDGTRVRAATSSSGQPFGAPTDLVTGADTPSSALLAGDGLGGLLATWTQADGANRRAFARLYDDTPPARLERRHSSGARRRPGRDVLGDGDGRVDRRHAGMGLRRRADRHRRAGEPLLRGGRAVRRQRPRPRRGGQPVRQDRTRRARDRAACGRRPRTGTGGRRSRQDRPRHQRPVAGAKDLRRGGSQAAGGRQDAARRCGSGCRRRRRSRWSSRGRSGASAAGAAA